jgi:hypothetical protein
VGPAAEDLTLRWVSGLPRVRGLGPLLALLPALLPLATSPIVATIGGQLVLLAVIALVIIIVLVVIAAKLIFWVVVIAALVLAFLFLR